MKELLKKLLPQTALSKIRQFRYSNERYAKRLGATSKRLDLCAAQVAHILHLCERQSIKGKFCLEIGSGWVLSHAIVFHLLGAKRVIATDIERLADLNALYSSIHSSELSIIRDVLSPFDNHSDIRQRLNNLISIKRFTFQNLKEIGVEYVSPVDLSRKSLSAQFDIIYSFSALEHVHCQDITPLISNMNQMLKIGGVMLHAIHLEDHADFNEEPFVFLTETPHSFTRQMQSRRGNRLRKSQWNLLFNNLPNVEGSLLYQWLRTDKALPTAIDQSIAYTDNDDLRVSHIGVYCKKA